MSRSIERADVPIGPNGSGVLFTVPPGHKYELRAVSLSTGMALGTAYLLIDSASITGTQFIDELAIAASRFATMANYNDCVFYEGDTLTALWLTGTTNPCVAIATFVDVDYSD